MIKLLSTVYLFIAYCLVLILWRFLNPTDLIFDQILFISLAVLIFYLVLKLFVRNLTTLRDRFSKCVILVSILLFYIFGTTMLMNIDRSRSVYVLKWVSSCSSTKITQDLACIIKSDQNKSEIFQRIEEQETRGLLIKSGQTYTLSLTGKAVLLLSEKLSIVFYLEGYKNA